MGEKKKMSGYEALVYLITLFGVVAPLCMILRAIAAKVLWNWFAVPLGAPTIGIVFFCGISCIISAFTTKAPTSDDKKTAAEGTHWEALGSMLGYGAMIPAILIFEGWVIKHFL